MNRRSVIMSSFFLMLFSAILFGDVPQVLYQNNGDSLESINCPRYRGGVPTIDTTDGNPAPSIDFFTNAVYTYGTALYTLPGLLPGQILHGTTDFKLLAIDSYPAISCFGNARDTQCNYDLSRRPLPSVECRPWAGTVDITYKNRAGVNLTLNVDCPLELGVWHRSELIMTPRAEGGYDFWILIDGVTVFQDISSEPIGTNELLGIEFGLGSSTVSHIRYDNIRIELEDACTYNPPDQPLVFVRETGKPVAQSVTWDSCGGPGVLRIQNSGVSAARILLNGQTVAGPSDFNPNLAILSFPVVLLSGENVLEVELRSKPGSQLTIQFTESE